MPIIDMVTRAAPLLASIILGAFLTSGVPVNARPVPAPEPLLRFPTANHDQVAFVAAGDLWTVPRTGGPANRLTDDPGQVLAPHFSPDGRLIAFTWRRGGANDVWIVPSSGGSPVQLTHGPSLASYDNLVTGWTPDGTKVLFASRRLSPLGRYDSYAVPTGGGLAVPLELGHAGLASMSPDGTRIVFDWSFRNLGGDRWKHYRGGQAGELFLWDRTRHSTERLTNWEGIDTAPMWSGDRLFFLSDRGPERRINLWVMDLKTKTARQITRYAEYDLDLPSIGPGGLSFVHAGRLHVLDPATCRIVQLKIRFPALAAERPYIIPADRFVTHEDIVGQPDYALGTDGTAYLAARGDLFALRLDGRWADLTTSPGSVEDHPAVSPDGHRIAFVTDEAGEQQVALLALDRSEPQRTLTRFSSGVLYTPRWSPDGKHLLVADGNKRLWLVSIDGSRVKRVAANPYAEIQDAAFSPDGRRIAYSVTRPDQTRALHVRDIDDDHDVELSAPGESDHDPAFTADGSALVFVSARREHPFVSDRDREGTIATIASDGVYRASMSATADLTLFRASARPVQVAGTGGFAQMTIRGGSLFYRAVPLAGIGGDLPGQTSALRSFDLDTNSDHLVSEGASSFAMAATATATAALVARKGAFSIVSLDTAHPDEHNLVIEGLRMTIDPPAERREMLDQAWRFDRDLFWDPDMNGVDWSEMRRRYLPLARQARSHDDMIYVLGEFQGELSTSHMFVGGGDDEDSRPRETTALLGVDFALDAASRRYRMARIYRGDGSRERFRAPLGDPASDVLEGDFLLAVNDTPLLAPEDPYRLLKNLHGSVRLTVAHSSTDPGRTVVVDPLADEAEIRKLAWIARDRATVDRLGGGSVGYLYLSDFDELGSEDFLRQYYQQTGMAALIIDDRDNRGGFTSQWVLDLLHRPQAGVFRNREGGVTSLPGAIAPSRLVTLTSIFSASDGDQFPYSFRKWGMGKVIGQRTWGGVRGIKGPWRLMDGTYVTVPKDSLLTRAGSTIIENDGAEPDTVIDDTPDDSATGRDRQLERALADVLKANL